LDFILNDYHRNVSDKELLDDILRVAKALGKESITIEEYMANGSKYHYSTIQRRFGGWTNALREAGLQLSQAQVSIQKVSENDLIEDLQKVANKLGKKTISSSEYSKHGKHSKQTVFRKFDTWNNALLMSGLQPFDHPLGGATNRISEYACFEEIERIWILLGRQPTTTDIKNGVSRYSLHVFERRFGSWRKALETFVAYMNGEKDAEIPEETEDIQLPVDVQQFNTASQPVHKTKREINLRMRFLVMKRDDFKCCMCGRSPATTPGLELHIDHIVPWSKGGETVIGNLQTLCSDCNLGKSDLSMD